MSSSWTPAGWRDARAAQQPDWPDPAALEPCLKQLSVLPPLVFPAEPAPPRTLWRPVAPGACPARPLGPIGPEQVVGRTHRGRRYGEVAGETDRALRLRGPGGVDPPPEAPLPRGEFWASHDALIL